MNDSNKIAKLIGQAFGVVLVGCAAICAGGVIVALTVKLLTWMF